MAENGTTIEHVSIIPVVAMSLVVAALVILVIVIVVVAVNRRPRRAAGPTQAGYSRSGLVMHGPLDDALISEIDMLLAAGQKIQAIKKLRMRTGEGLAESKRRIDTWDVAAERRALLSGIPGYGGAQSEDPRAIEVRAIVRTSGWQQAEAYLRDHHGMTSDQVATFLRGIGPV